MGRKRRSRSRSVSKEARPRVAAGEASRNRGGGRGQAPPEDGGGGQQGGHGLRETGLGQYAEFVNMPVAIVSSFLVPTIMHTAWRTMTRDQRFMLLVLFAGTIASALATFALSASFITATAPHAAVARSRFHHHANRGTVGSAFSCTLHLFLFLSFLCVIFLVCLQTPCLRGTRFPYTIGVLAIVGCVVVSRLPKYVDRINTPNLHRLWRVALCIAVWTTSLAVKLNNVFSVLQFFHSSKTYLKTFSTLLRRP